MPRISGFCLDVSSRIGGWSLVRKAGVKSCIGVSKLSVSGVCGSCLVVVVGVSSLWLVSRICDWCLLFVVSVSY